MRHTHSSHDRKISRAEILRERLLDGRVLLVSNLADEFFGKTDSYHKTLIRQTFIAMRSSLEKNKTRTLICQEGYYQLLGRPRNRVERAEEQEVSRIRGMRVEAFFRSFERNLSTLLYHQPRALPLAESRLMRIEDMVRTKKRSFLKKQLTKARRNIKSLKRGRK